MKKKLFEDSNVSLEFFPEYGKRYKIQTFYGDIVKGQLWLTEDQMKSLIEATKWILLDIF